MEPTATDDTTPHTPAPTNPYQATLADARKRKKRNSAEVPICLDPELATAAQLARAEADAARARLDLMGNKSNEMAATRLAELEALEVAAEEAEDAARAESVVFRFEGLGSDEFDKLIDGHQPNKEQRVQFRRENPGRGELAWNSNTFPPALVAATLVAPTATAEEVEAMFADPQWNRAELDALFQAALGVCQQRRVVPFSPGSRRTPS